MAKLQRNNATVLEKLQQNLMLIKTGRLNKQNNRNMNTSEEKEDKKGKLTTTCPY